MSDINPESRLELEWLRTELSLLQSEMDKRLERHGYSFYISVTLIAGVIVGVATALSSSSRSVPPETILAALVFLPWLTMPLAGMFFDDEMLRGVTEIHIHTEVAPRIRELLTLAGCDPAKVFRGTIHGRYILLNQMQIKRPRAAASLRRLLFLIPFIAALGSLVSLLCFYGSHLPGDYWIAVLPGFAGDLLLAFWLRVTWMNAARLWNKIGGK